MNIADNREAPDAFLSVAETARNWGISERSVRNYCAQGRVDGAQLRGKTWHIPADARKPQRSNAKGPAGSLLLGRLQQEKDAGTRGGIYHRLQIDLTYSSNHMEGSTLTPEQTRLIFETATILPEGAAVRVDDIVEAVNHFRAIDAVISSADRPLTLAFVKKLHGILKAGTTDAALDWFRVGDWKTLPNEVGGHATVPPEEVGDAMAALVGGYEALAAPVLDDLLDFHVQFERIHPFQDGNGRVGRLLLLKECLRHGIVPFVLGDDLRAFYYRGLSEWQRERGFLRDTCLTAQDRFKLLLDGFRIPYEG